MKTTMEVITEVEAVVEEATQTTTENKWSKNKILNNFFVSISLIFCRTEEVTTNNIEMIDTTTERTNILKNQIILKITKMAAGKLQKVLNTFQTTRNFNKNSFKPNFCYSWSVARFGKTKVIRQPPKFQ